MSELRMLTDSLSTCVFGESFRAVLSVRSITRESSASTPKLLTAAMLGRSASYYLGCVLACRRGEDGTICRSSASGAAKGCGKPRRLCRDNATVRARIYGRRNTTRLVTCWGRHVSPDLARGSGSHTVTKCGVLLCVLCRVS